MRFASRYEIFEKLPLRQPKWVETARSLEDAKKRLKELSLEFPADYFIFDTQNACFIVPHPFNGDAVETG